MHTSPVRSNRRQRTTKGKIISWVWCHRVFSAPYSYVCILIYMTLTMHLFLIFFISIQSFIIIDIIIIFNIDFYYSSPLYILHRSTVQDVISVCVRSSDRFQMPPGPYYTWYALVSQISVTLYWMFLYAIVRRSAMPFDWRLTSSANKRPSSADTKVAMIPQSSSRSTSRSAHSCASRISAFDCF